MRCGSRKAGSFEHAFFAAPARGETDRMLEACRAALDAGRRLRRRAGGGARARPGGPGVVRDHREAVRVYEELCTLARLNAGRVYPSYDRLAAATALGRATVARAIAALETAGFLVRQRLFARAAPEGVGWRCAQTSNGYRPTLPAGFARRLAALRPQRLAPTALPDDVVQHRLQHAADQQRLRRQLSCRELAETSLSRPLARALARLGAAIDARESHADPATPSLIHPAARDRRTRRRHASVA